MKLSRIYYKIKQGIINCYKWFYVIWNDRQYDGTFIFIILDKKLRMMKEHFESINYPYKGIDKDIEKLEKCVSLLDEIITEDEEMNIINKLEEKWGTLEMVLKANGEVSFNRDGVNTEEDRIECRNDSQRWSEEERKKQNERVNKVLRLIENNWRNWWT